MEWKPEVTLTSLQMLTLTYTTYGHQFGLSLAYNRVGLGFLILHNLGH